jgi:hypothetical protein
MSKRSKKSTRSNGKSSPTPTNARSRRLKPAKPAPLPQQDMEDSDDAPIPKLGRPPKPAKPAVVSLQDMEDSDEAPIPNLGRRSSVAKAAGTSSDFKYPSSVATAYAETLRVGGKESLILDPAEFTHSAIENLGYAAKRIENMYRLHAGVCGPEMSYHFEQEPRPLPGWDGKVDPRDALRRSVWIKLARSCLRHRVDPEVLFSNILEEYTQGSVFQPPHHYLLELGSSDQIKRLRTRSHLETKRKLSLTVRSIDTELQYLMRVEGYSAQSALRRVMLCSTYGFPWVHRFVVAWRTRDVSLIKPLATNATIQYAFQSALWHEVEKTGSMPKVLMDQRKELDDLVNSDELDEGGPGRG